MATVYSLICFGGRLGKTVTFTDAGDVVNLTRHGLRDGTGVVFSTTGALPTGITAGTTYYSKQGADNGKFTIWTDATLTTQVTFTGAGSGTNTVKGSYRNSLTTDQLLRYGAAGSERIYDSIANCNTTRAAAANTFDAEVFEVGEDFVDDLNTGGVTFALIAPTTTITPINGAGHNGVYDTGYTIQFASPNVASGVFIISCRMAVRGITLKQVGAGSMINISYALAEIDSCVLIDTGTATAGAYGIRNIGIFSRITNNLIKGFKRGFEVISGVPQQLIANNTVVGNDVGFYCAASGTFLGYYYNNISVGNTTLNWSAAPGGMSGAGSNCGLSGDTTWNTSPNSAITIATTDFYSYGSNDFRPRPYDGTYAPQVDAAVEYYQIISTDIAGNERPNYNNGGAEGYDCGAYEFDHGYGPHPAATTVTFSGVISGSEIHVYDSTDTELIGTESCTANQVLTWNIPANPTVQITIIKRGLRWQKFSYVSTVGDSSIPIFPQPDLGYNNPA